MPTPIQLAGQAEEKSLSDKISSNFTSMFNFNNAAQGFRQLLGKLRASYGSQGAALATVLGDIAEGPIVQDIHNSTHRLAWSWYPGQAWTANLPGFVDPGYALNTEQKPYYWGRRIFNHNPAIKNINVPGKIVEGAQLTNLGSEAAPLLTPAYTAMTYYRKGYRYTRTAKVYNRATRQYETKQVTEFVEFAECKDACSYLDAAIEDATLLLSTNGVDLPVENQVNNLHTAIGNRRAYVERIRQLLGFLRQMLQPYADDLLDIAAGDPLKWDEINPTTLAGWQSYYPGGSVVIQNPDGSFVPA